MRVLLEIPGPPMGKGRPRAGKTRDGKPIMYTPAKTAVFENLVKWLYAATYKDRRLSGPLQAWITCEYAVPQSAGKRERERMLAGELRPTKKPDCDNVAKIILDALNGVAYDDDKQVVELFVTKVYGPTPRTMVLISDISESTGGADGMMGVAGHAVLS